MSTSSMLCELKQSSANQLNFWGMDQALWNQWRESVGIGEHLGELLWRKFWKGAELQIPPWALSLVESHLQFTLPEIVSTQASADGTVKFLLRMRDGQEVETVIVPFPGRHTLCLSTQVGCAMACSFCHTGLQGLKRHLRVEEIIGQYLVGQRWLRDHRPETGRWPKIVFMGQGEPLHNFESLKRAISIFLHPQQIALGPRCLTISTAGYLPGLLRLNELPLVNLALSLHSPFNDQRTELIPINQRYPLERILPPLDERPRLKKQFINFEYLLIKDYNDSDKHLDALKELLTLKVRPGSGIINIIPYNFVPGLPWQRPSFDQAHDFQRALRSRGIYATVRTTKGEEIMAACGQLSTRKIVEVRQ